MKRGKLLLRLTVYPIVGVFSLVFFALLVARVKLETKLERLDQFEYLESGITFSRQHLIVYSFAYQRKDAQYHDIFIWTMLPWRLTDRFRAPGKTTNADIHYLHGFSTKLRLNFMESVVDNKGISELRDVSNI